MWNPVALPYENENNTFPLPTTEEIRACTNLVHERSACKIVAVNEQVVVKHGGGVDEWEGQALIYLEQHVPAVPAPRLYAMYRDSTGKQLFLVMQRVPGVQLNQLWPSLSDADKDTITEQLRGIFTALRHAKSPWPHCFGGIDGGPVRHYLLYDQNGSQTHLGPFRDEAAFVIALTDNFRGLMESNHHPLHKVRLYEDHLGHALRHHRPVLTHGDVHRKNIMVADKGMHGGKKTFEIVLVDWEMAGWLPDYWEYFIASLTFGFDDDDWVWRTGHFLPVWLSETAVMRMLHKDVAGY